MKKKIIYSAIAAMMACSTATAQERIHEIVFDSDEQFVEEPDTYIIGASIYPKSIFVSDLDSIKFDVKNQKINVFGSVNGSLKTAWYDLAKLNGFSLTYLDDGVMPSTMLDGDVNRNSINVTWRPIEGASGYEIAYIEGLHTGVNRYDWIFTNEARHVTVGADVTNVKLTDLKYGTEYCVAIRVLSPKGEGYHSQWSMRNRFATWVWDYTAFYTENRVNVPSLIAPVRTDFNSIVLMLDTETVYDASTVDPTIEIVNGKCVYDKLMVQELGGEKRFIDVTDAHRTAGEIVVDGLKEGAIYTFALYNSHLKECDAYYAAISCRTKGTPGAPILIKHKVASEVTADPSDPNIDMDREELNFEGEQEFQACRIDTIITNFNSDINLAEGQTFMLEGGKTYYLRQMTNLVKGFTLCTDPADLAAGKGRAKVYFCDFGSRNSINLLLGKAKDPGEFNATIYIDKVIFRDIDFDAPLAQNKGMAQENGAYATGNYFINSVSSTLPYEYESIECHNCTFQHFVRGFFRVQGASKKIINHIKFNNCVFMNLGMYNANGMDYRFIHGEQANADDNFAKDIQITNNTFYD
ncbi:MAG: fibronectin type III domain-containing protein, partial [Duncaniella sp.]|nr:fibronectin type III domain-containing protein [Duncaniella sp.]